MNRRSMLGTVLVAVGCVWLVLILFHIQPLFLSLFLVGVWLKPSNGFDEILTVVSSFEYLFALGTVASGLAVWRRSVTRRWPLKLIFVGLAVFTVGMGTRSVIRKEAAQKRDAGYKWALAKYSKEFGLGKSRKNVEDYLHGNGTEFEQLCCIEQKDSYTAYADLVRVGQEDVPWFCSENTVYVAFEFVAAEPNELVKAYPSDSLKKVSIFRQLTGCL